MGARFGARHGESDAPAERARDDGAPDAGARLERRGARPKRKADRGRARSIEELESGRGASKSTPTTDAPQDNLQDSFVAADESWVVETATDAQGRWQLDDLPAGGTANIALRKAPYARAAFDLNLKDETAPPLFLKPGAAIAGQIVAPDGQPITGQLVVASWSGDRDAQTRTDAQGRFEIDGLAAGQTHLSPRDYTSGQREPAPQFLLPQQDMIKLSAGETTDIGQWQAQLGTTIKMRVVTQPPANPSRARSSTRFVAATWPKSDVKGELQARVMRNDSIAPSFGSVWPRVTKAPRSRNRSIARRRRPWTRA